MRLRVTGLVLVALSSCERPASSAVFDVGTVVAANPVEAPEPVTPTQLPVMTPCPEGWRQAEESPVVCEPWPAAEPARCAADEVHFPGAPGCARLGTACPAAGEFAVLPDGARARYVLAGAPSGGTGTAVAPFSTLGAALQGAQPGDVLALGAGTYALDQDLPAGITVWGACVGGTTLSATVATRAAVVRTSSVGVVLRNLRVSSQHPGLIASGSGASIQLQDVLFGSVQGAGMILEGGAHVSADAVAILNTGDQGGDASGVELGSGSELVATRFIIDGVSAFGILADGAGTRAVLTQSAIRNVTGRVPQGTAGRGVSAQVGARVELHATVVEHTREDGLIAIQAGFQLEDVVVRDTKGRVSDGQFGVALSLNGSTATGKRVRLEQSLQGIDVRKTTGTAQLTDVVLRDLRATADLASGSAFAAVLGATFSLERVFVLRASRTAVAVGSTGTQGRLTDLTVLDTLPGPGSGTAVGVYVLSGARLAMTRAELRRNSLMGLAMAGELLEVSDVVVSDTAESSTSTSGAAGFFSYAGTTLGSRVFLERNATTGLMASDGAQVTLDDLRVGQSRASPRDGVGGVAIQAITGAKVSSTRVRLEGNGMAGVHASGSGTLVKLTQASVVDTVLPPCVGPCAAEVSAGLMAVEGGAIDASQFVIARNGGIGVQLDAQGQIDLRDGTVTQHVVGANVMNPTYDLGRLDDDVRYVDNEQKVSNQIYRLPTLPGGPKP